jgi:hypothetical protein
MLKKLSHSFKIIKNPTHPQTHLQQPGFISYINIRRNDFPSNKNQIANLKKTNLYVYTDHLLECSYFNCDLEKEMNNYYTNNTPLPQEYFVCKQPYKPEIHFPATTSFATYKYFFPGILLAGQNTFIFVGVTNFKKINLTFTNNSNTLSYNILINDHFLETIKK